MCRASCGKAITATGRESKQPKLWGMFAATADATPWRRTRGQQPTKSAHSALYTLNLDGSICTGALILRPLRKLGQQPWQLSIRTAGSCPKSMRAFPKSMTANLPGQVIGGGAEHPPEPRSCHVCLNWRGPKAWPASAGHGHALHMWLLSASSNLQPQSGLMRQKY